MSSTTYVYVDGFNFYNSLLEEDIEQWGYVDFALLAKNAIEPVEAVAKVKYFTALDKPQEYKIARQTQRWWKALEFSGVDVIKGAYRKYKRNCRCGKCVCRPTVWTEKQTDVNLGFEVGFDVDAWDHAVLLTGDSDFLGVARRLQARRPEKSVTILLPPGQHGHSFRAEGISVKQITVDLLQRSLLPRRVPNPDGSGEFAEAWHEWRSQEDVAPE